MKKIKSKQITNKEENMLEIKGLSSKEVKIIAWLEFYQKYFFTSKDIKQFFSSKNALYRGVQKLLSKKRIIKLNQNKYYLVPIKAKSGGWAEEDFMIIDEICNSGEYYIGGWSAANYWRLTDQIPFWHDVFTTNKRGRKKIFNTGIIFHQVRKIDKFKYTIKKIKEHEFKVLNKGATKKWMKLRQ